jgi:hypothetical protein
MEKMLQWTLRLGQNVTVDVVNLDVTSRQLNELVYLKGQGHEILAG